MGKRITRQAEDNVQASNESETVMTFTSSVEDPILNPPKKEEEKTTGIPRPDDHNNTTPVPEYLTNLIEKAPQDNTDTEEKVFNDLETSKQEKRDLFAKATSQKLLLQKNLKAFSAYRQKRAIPILALPSGMKTYPENVSVSYSPYTVQDIEDINNNDMPLLNKYLIMLDGIYTEGMSPLELTFSDFLFIGDTRHLQSLGDSHFKYPYVCSTCGKAGTFQFQLSDIGFTNLDTELPIRVRFHTFPDEVFSFTPHTIGDVINLLKTDRYWRTIGEDYIRTDEGKHLIDTIAIGACCCISHSWEDAYFKLLELSENPEDRSILIQVDRLLYHGTEPIKFRCMIPLDKDEQRKVAEQTATLVEGVVEGELSTNEPNTEKEGLPPWIQALEGKKAGGSKECCGAINYLDVTGRDIIIPFRRHPINMEYGILLS